MRRQKHTKLRIPVLILLAIIIAAGGFLLHFGGFGTGKSADPEEYRKYAEPVESITVPEGVCVVALGEATHGNAELQQLKLDVFKVLVENNGVRGFALEGSYGGCEAVNRYIHGGEGDAAQAAASIGFAIYRTEQIERLIEWMREYNSTAAKGEDLRFYGIDCQRYEYEITYLREALETLDVDAQEELRMFKGNNWEDSYPAARRKEILTALSEKLKVLPESADSLEALHLVDILLQYTALEEPYDAEGGQGSYSPLRDGFMAENTKWVLEQEKARGHNCIFLSAHNGHVQKTNTYYSTGVLLAGELGDAYYAIGTDFYRTRCNLPKKNRDRTVKTFYSHDEIAKAQMKAELSCGWLDFNAVPADSSLDQYISGPLNMGSLGEMYSPLMRLLPYTYHVALTPKKLYDGMIFVTECHPTEIR